MSYLLYLHGVKWESFESAFHQKKPNVAAVVRNMNLPHLRKYSFPELTDEKAAELVKSTLSSGVDYDALSDADAALLDVIVDRAFMTRALGLKTTPLSPMGIGAAWLDELEPAFRARAATDLWRALRNGRRLGRKPERARREGAPFLLSPDEVRAASVKLAEMAEDEGDDFHAEIAEPFAKAAKKKLGLRGTWS